MAVGDIMTSGRLPCSDCGRNSPRGRHASCHVLAILKAADGDAISKTELLRAVYPYRWSQLVPGEWPDISPIHGAITTLRKRGHRIVSINAVVALRGTP